MTDDEDGMFQKQLSLFRKVPKIHFLGQNGTFRSQNAAKNDLIEILHKQTKHIAQKINMTSL